MWFDVLKIDWDGPGGMKEKIDEMQRNLDEGIFDPLDEWADEMAADAEDNKAKPGFAAPKNVTLVSGPKPLEAIDVKDQAALAAAGTPPPSTLDPEPVYNYSESTGDEDADRETMLEFNNRKLEWLKRQKANQENQENKSMWFNTIKAKKKKGDKRYGRKWTKTDRRLYNKRKAKEEIERDRKDVKE